MKKRWNVKHIEIIFITMIMLFVLIGCAAGTQYPQNKQEGLEQHPADQKPNTAAQQENTQENTEEEKEAVKDEKPAPAPLTEEKKSAEVTVKAEEKPSQAATDTKQQADSEKTDAEEDLSHKETIVITIQGKADEPPILPATVVSLEEGDTVLDVLLRITRQERIHAASRGRGKTGYVEAIGNLYEFEHGAGSGWMFSVNGIFPNRSAGAFEVESGDSVTWWYTLDAGRDLEAVVQ